MIDNIVILSNLEMLTGFALALLVGILGVLCALLTDVNRIAKFMSEIAKAQPPAEKGRDE